MVRRVATRSQRRSEKKQVLILLALVLIVSLVSFALGVMVGRGNRPAAAAAQAARLPVAEPATPPAGATAGGGKQSESLTFYDSLAKGGKPPLGSGINLPPPSAPPPVTDAPTDGGELPGSVTEISQAAAVDGPPAQSADVAPIISSPPKKAAPAAGKSGAYLVQAAAFRRMEDASSLEAKLLRKGYAAFTRETLLGDKGVWYRVYIGPFPAAGSAEETVFRLKREEKLTAMIRKN